jgi:hypothetical protein
MHLHQLSSSESVSTGRPDGSQPEPRAKKTKRWWRGDLRQVLAEVSGWGLMRVHHMFGGGNADAIRVFAVAPNAACPHITLNSDQKGVFKVKPEIKEVSIRFPLNIKTWLEREAANNYRSQNAEVLAILKEKMNARTSA